MHVGYARSIVQHAVQKICFNVFDVTFSLATFVQLLRSSDCLNIVNVTFFSRDVRWKILRIEEP